MNKTLILGSRNSGKTYCIVQEAINAHGIIICVTEDSKNYINNILREQGHSEVPVFTFAETRSGKIHGMIGPLFVDEAQTLLREMLVENVGNLPLGGYSFDTTDTDLLFLRNSL